MLERLFPFLAWRKDLNTATLRADLIAGITVALVLVPQSMAYAQLAGLPPYYGLYAAFLPPTVAALFGSSRQLATGPVAVVSLMTAATLEPLATAGSEQYVAYAILLAFIVGLFQLSMGLLRLGALVNFLAHPVVVGFTNAAALIIATSQLSKLFGVDVDKAEHHYETVIAVVREALSYSHWPTVALGALAFGIMIGLRRVAPKLPNVLIAVVATILISWATGFQRIERAELSAIQSSNAVEAIETYNSCIDEIDRLATA
ncbi:SulP family inorganic anion transporter, partial [Planctomycetota bacterium]